MLYWSPPPSFFITTTTTLPLQANKNSTVHINSDVKKQFEFWKRTKNKALVGGAPTRARVRGRYEAMHKDQGRQVLAATCIVNAAVLAFLYYGSF